jgi:hypothetical protein
MHYVSRRSHQMHKHKFDATCPFVMFVEFVTVLAEHDKLCVDVL